MTLIITVTTAHRVFQVSDRRFTWDGRPQLFTDEENKAVYIACQDAHFSIAYTGLGTIGDKRTDRWLAETLHDLGAAKLRLKAVIDLLQSLVGVSIPPSWKERRLALVLAGYRYPNSSLVKIPDASEITFRFAPEPEVEDELLRIPPELFSNRPFITRIGNFGGRQGRGSNALRDRVTVDNYKLPRDPQVVAYSIEGNLDAVTKHIMWQMKGLAREGFFSGAPEEEISARIVSLVHEAADTPKSGTSIGKHCLSVILTPNGRDTISAFYYSPEAKRVRRFPYVVTANTAIRDMEVWSGDERPPWRHSDRKDSSV